MRVEKSFNTFKLIVESKEEAQALLVALWQSEESIARVLAENSILEEVPAYIWRQQSLILGVLSNAGIDRSVFSD